MAQSEETLNKNNTCGTDYRYKVALATAAGGLIMLFCWILNGSIGFCIGTRTILNIALCIVLFMISCGVMTSIHPTLAFLDSFRNLSMSVLVIFVSILSYQFFVRTDFERLVEDYIKKNPDIRFFIRMLARHFETAP